jgi:nucleotide-binding universal stress UspA family protein
LAYQNSHGILVTAPLTAAGLIQIKAQRANKGHHQAQLRGDAMYDNILIPVLLDPEHDPAAAMSAARALANDGAQVTLLHVLEELPAYATAYVAMEVLDLSRQAAMDRLKELAAQYDDANSELVTGHSARTILSWAEEHAADCIIVSSHKPGMQDYFLGGTAARVVRYAPCAVHVIR